MYKTLSVLKGIHGSVPEPEKQTKGISRESIVETMQATKNVRVKP